MRSAINRLVFAGAGVLLLGAGTAGAQTLTLATDNVGSTYNAVGSGFAKTITENSKRRVIVRPHAGPDAYLDQLDRGEINFATFSSSTAFIARQGNNRAKKKYLNLRLITAGEGGLYVGFATLAKSGIKTLADLKGKRVASDFGGHAVIGKSISGALAAAGLTWADVKPVPVTGANDGIRAMDNGRVDASWSSLGQPVARELHAKEGLRYLSVPDTPEALAKMRSIIFPGVNVVTVKATPAIGLPEDTKLINYDAYLAGNAKLKDEDVKAVLEAVWDHFDQLQKIHRGLRGFSQKAA
ncbi:MAG: TAXI family TRAP transporter solute-binding subunit, partial [Hyphomicrobiaceae bacterium]